MRVLTPVLLLLTLGLLIFMCGSIRHTAQSSIVTVEEFTDYDSVVVFSDVARAYIVKFFVTSH